MHPHHPPHSASSAPADDGTLPLEIPRALLLDPRLTPLERNAWIVLRVRPSVEGASALPSYEELRPLLACMPHAKKASFETVARAITVLRLTGWITLNHRRDPLTGRIQANTYGVHQAPASFVARCAADAGYPRLLEQSFSHASGAIRQVAQDVLREIAADPKQAALLPRYLRQRMPPETVAPDIQNDPLPTTDDPAPPLPEVPPDTAPGQKPALRAIRHVRTENSLNQEKRTYRVPPHGNDSSPPSDLRLPQRFTALMPDQRQDALAQLRQVPPTQRQAVLDEWAARCQREEVRRPSAYLFGLIRRALSGVFRPCVAQQATLQQTTPQQPTPQQSSTAAPTEPVPVSTAPTRPAPATRGLSEVGRVHLAKLHELLRMPEPADPLLGARMA